METTSGSSNPATLARLAIVALYISIAALMLLHVVSPEFSPSWRMISEYANGRFEWLLMIFFISWGISGWLLSWVLWPKLTTIASRIGCVLLIISGLGTMLAAVFNVNHPQHGTTGTLGVPTFVIASLLISYHLKNKPEWAKYRSSLLWSAHFTWITLVALAVTMVVMIAGFKNAGIAIGPGEQPPASVPDGVMAVVGYVNRLLVLAFMFWTWFVAKTFREIAKLTT